MIHITSSIIIGFFVLLFLSGCGNDSSSNEEYAPRIENGPLIPIVSVEDITDSSLEFLHYSVYESAEEVLRKHNLPKMKKASSILGLEDGSLIILYGSDEEGVLVLLRLVVDGTGGYYVLERQRAFPEDMLNFKLGDFLKSTDNPKLEP